MNNVPNTDQARADLRERAIRALHHFGAKDRGQAETLLSMWAHAGRLTAVDREIVLSAFGGPRLTTDEPCPPWCVVDHSKVYEDTVRECASASYAVPTMDGARYAPDKQLTVEAVRFVDLLTGRVGPAQVRIGDTVVAVSDASNFADFVESVVLVADLD